jgi:hypothetical protein
MFLLFAGIPSNVCEKWEWVDLLLTEMLPEHMIGVRYFSGLFWLERDRHSSFSLVLDFAYQNSYCVLNALAEVTLHIHHKNRNVDYSVVIDFCWQSFTGKDFHRYFEFFTNCS